MATKLSKSMTEQDFVNGYWYAVEIKAFAKEIGISSVSRLRKDELETIILRFIRTGKVGKPKRSGRKRRGKRDFEIGLHPDLPIVSYTNNRITKDFLWAEARKIDSELRPKSGAMYRLNRWREDQVNAGKKISYGDLASRYVSLCRTKGPFPKVPTGRYINFLSDFLKGEKSVTHKMAREAWAELKRLPIPKTYAAWKNQE